MGNSHSPVSETTELTLPPTYRELVNNEMLEHIGRIMDHWKVEQQRFMERQNGTLVNQGREQQMLMDGCRNELLVNQGTNP